MNANDKFNQTLRLFIGNAVVENMTLAAQRDALQVERDSLVVTVEALKAPVAAA